MLASHAGLAVSGTPQITEAYIMGSSIGLSLQCRMVILVKHDVLRSDGSPADRGGRWVPEHRQQAAASLHTWLGQLGGREWWWRK